MTAAHSVARKLMHDLAAPAHHPGNQSACTVHCSLESIVADTYKLQYTNKNECSHSSKGEETPFNDPQSHLSMNSCFPGTFIISKAPLHLMGTFWEAAKTTFVIFYGVFINTLTHLWGDSIAPNHHSDQPHSLFWKYIGTFSVSKMFWRAILQACYAAERLCDLTREFCPCQRFHSFLVKNDKLCGIINADQ